jgi:hypothetical protein
MANLYSVLPGLTPSSQEILEAELLAKQVLEGKYPDLDLREGTGLRDLVLRPTAYAFALLKKATDYYFTQNTIATVNDATPSEVVDDLLSNWFLTRNTGTKSVISARLFFARAKNVTLTSDVGFSPDNKLYFFPEASQAYPSDAMSYDAYSNEWYLDVSMAAADTGTEYNLSEGSLLYFSSFDPYFLRAEINYLISESSPSETNSEFISRAGSSISTRNLVNIPSIESNLQKSFNYLERVLPVGAGDPDMIRDMIVVYPPVSVAYQSTAYAVSGSTVTLTIGAHTLQSGQSVTLSGALPELYNNVFTITEIDVDHISVFIPSNPGYISALPTVSLKTSPVYIHDAGSVDVYCGSRVSTSVMQLTTDSSGVATLSGPVFNLKRSLVSGGDQEDTIPTSVSVGYTSYFVDSTAGRVTLNTSTSTITAGSTLFLSGLTQYETASAISCTGITVTVKLAYGHGVKAGDTITVSGVTPTAYNGVFTVSSVSATELYYTAKSQISGPGSGTILVTNNRAFENPNIVLAAGPLVIAELPHLWQSSSSAVSGTLSITQDVDHTILNPYVRSPQEAVISITNGTARVLMFNHGVTAGREVLLSGYSLIAANDYWRVTEVVNGSEFLVDVSGAGLPDSAAGPAFVTYVTNEYDYGFSTKQKLLVDFGSTYANSTASFEVSTFRDVYDVQDYLNSPDNRVICGDYLARGFNIIMLDLDIVSYGLVAFSTTLIQSAAESYLKSIPVGGTFVLSDLVSSLYQSEITNIRTPVGVKYTRYTRDLAPPTEGVILDYLDPSDKTNVFLLRDVSSTVASLS